jgi:hypothetical protein
VTRGTLARARSAGTHDRTVARAHTRSAWPTSLSSASSEHGHHSRRHQSQPPPPPAHAAVHEVSSPDARRVRTQLGNSPLLLLPLSGAGCRPRAWPRSHGHGDGGVDQKGVLLTASPDAWLVRHASRGTSATHRAGGEEPSSSSGSATSSGMASGGTFRNVLLALPLCLALASLVRMLNCSSRFLVPSWGAMVRRFPVEPLLNWWHCCVVSVAVARGAPGWLGIRLVARRRGGSGSRTIPLGRMGHRSRSLAATFTISALFLR